MISSAHVCFAPSIRESVGSDDLLSMYRVCTHTSYLAGRQPLMIEDSLPAHLLLQCLELITARLRFKTRLFLVMSVAKAEVCTSICHW
jgi:hypothetical protein